MAKQIAVLGYNGGMLVYCMVCAEESKAWIERYYDEGYHIEHRRWVVTDEMVGNFSLECANCGDAFWTGSIDTPLLPNGTLSGIATAEYHNIIRCASAPSRPPDFDVEYYTNLDRVVDDGDGEHGDGCECEDCCTCSECATMRGE